MTNDRKTIFVSHATPSDNEFAIWLSARLAAAGYDVWCDQEKLLGGEDFWKDIEIALRNKVIKFVLVISKHIKASDGTIRDGIAKEIAVAEAIKKTSRDPYFIIPALIDDTPYDQFGIEFIRLNGISFRPNWAAGLAQLIKVLERDSVPHDASIVQPSMSAWRGVHQALARSISDSPEVLQSNWLDISAFPEFLNFFDVQLPYSFAEIQSVASACALPCTDHGRLLAGFATLDEMRSVLGESVPINLRGSLRLTDFLQGRTGDILGISPSDARKKVSSLVRQAWGIALEKRGLTAYEMASGHNAWWFPEGIPADGQLHYEDLNGKPRRRAVRGIRGKKELEDGSEVPKYFWHLGFTATPFIGDVAHLVLKPRIIISDDNKTPLKSKKKLNSVRRALTKMWFNDKWRGLILGIAAWLADGQGYIALATSPTTEIRVAKNPTDFALAFGIAADPAQIEEDAEERFEEEQTVLRAEDPAFAGLDDEEEGEGE